MGNDGVRIVTDLPYENVSSAAVGADEKLYVLCGGYDEQ